MKYYIYLSETKVDMLYEQIPKRLKDRLATELKIDLKFLSTTFTEEASEGTRIAKLKVVTEYIKNNLPLGTVDMPKKYFQGSLRLHWGLFKNMAYFCGMTERTIFGLGGSFANVIGSVGKQPRLSHLSPSTLLGMNMLITYQVIGDRMDQDEKGIDIERENISRPDFFRAFEAFTLEIMGLKSGYEKDPRYYLERKFPLEEPHMVVQRVEFLAKRLTEGFSRSEDKLLLVGTPIFVAQVD